ncbi:MmcB family DNA repair protein [Heyndrickxia coagulans]
MGYDEQGHIVIVEIKVSLLDFERDNKWNKYLSYCDEFYFFRFPLFIF